MAGPQEDLEQSAGGEADSAAAEDNSNITRVANALYPPAQFVNELASVGVPVYELLRTTGLAAIPAVILASITGGVSGTNTFFTAGHYQGARMGLSRAASPEARRADTRVYIALSVSMWLTVFQWWMNTLFIYRETKQSLFNNNNDLSWQEFAIVSAVYMLCQALYDLLSDSVESVQEYIDRKNYSDLTDSFALLPARCLQVLFCCKPAEIWVRTAGSGLQTVTRLMPLLVWGFQYLSLNVALAVNIPVALIIGAVIFTQKYYFAGKSVQDNITKLSGYLPISAQASLPWIIGNTLYGTLYLAGPLEGIDAFLGPFAYISLICQIAAASPVLGLSLAIGLAGLVALAVGLGTDRSERRESQKAALQDTQSRNESGWYNLGGLWSGNKIRALATDADEGGYAY